MAFVDLAHLTRNNVRGNVLVYYRVKTKTEIRVTITSGMRRLLEKYARDNSNLLFPVLQSEEVSYERYKVALRTYNRRLATIGDMIDCPVKLTSYVARHSWAMQAKRKFCFGCCDQSGLGAYFRKNNTLLFKRIGSKYH